MTPVPLDVLTTDLTLDALKSLPDSKIASIKAAAGEHKTLPAQWNRDERIFQLEKRALFSKVICTRLDFA